MNIAKKQFHNDPDNAEYGAKLTMGKFNDK